MKLHDSQNPLWVRRRREMGGGGGGSSGSFRRQGTGTHVRSYGVPDDIRNLVTSNVANSATSPELAQKQTQLFGRLMDQTPEQQPGYNALSSFANLSPTDYSGRSTLFNVSRRDPYSGAYEQQTTDAYRNRAADAMATVATGPDAVRGGDARTGVMQGVMAEQLAANRGQEVRNAQLQDLGAVIQSAMSMGQIENTRTEAALRAALGASGVADGVANRALDAGKQVDVNKLQNLSLLQLAAQLMGTTVDTQTDNFSGKGSQDGWQAGVSCCFIFAEALNGELPWYIELARHEFLTPNRKRGYTWMASWLVPAMRKSRVCRWAVNTFIIKPFLRYGAWFYGEDLNYNVSAWLAPYCQFWLTLWAAIGKVKHVVSRTS